MPFAIDYIVGQTFTNWVIDVLYRQAHQSWQFCQIISRLRRLAEIQPARSTTMRSILPMPAPRN